MRRPGASAACAGSRRGRTQGAHASDARAPFQMPNKILMVVTSHDQLGDTGERTLATGAWARRVPPAAPALTGRRGCRAGQEDGLLAGGVCRALLRVQGCRRADHRGVAKGAGSRRSTRPARAKTSRPLPPAASPRTRRLQRCWRRPSSSRRAMSPPSTRCSTRAGTARCGIWPKSLRASS